MQLSNHNRFRRLLGILLITLVSFNVLAKPAYVHQYKSQYGYSPSCQACHKDGGGSPVNDYGEAFKKNGQNISAFKLIALLDSDNDGINNGIEASNKANPGNKNSTPTNQGDWLDLSSLIPKLVQKSFPLATAWKPLDAMMTDKDIARAKEMGVTLSAEDVNTIYIPVANRRPIGTALIFPVIHQDKTFFLLMTTDRQLNISKVVPLNSDQLPEEVDSTLLQTFVGTPLQSVQLQQTNQLSTSVSRSVKRAGVLVYMRLKGA